MSPDTFIKLPSASSGVTGAHLCTAGLPHRTLRAGLSQRSLVDPSLASPLLPAGRGGQTSFGLESVAGTAGSAQYELFQDQENR